MSLFYVSSGKLRLSLVTEILFCALKRTATVTKTVSILNSKPSILHRNNTIPVQEKSVSSTGTHSVQGSSKRTTYIGKYCLLTLWTTM